MKLYDRVTLAILFVAACATGCGSPVVDPGRATHQIPAQIQQPLQSPVNPSGLPTLEAPEVQQVPAESVLNLPSDSQSATYHTVQSGETLTSISKRYGISTERLRSANGLDASAKLKSQQLIFIPK
jgi:LysM repeat protein